MPAAPEKNKYERHQSCAKCNRDGVDQ
ncbi:hypothetical protein OF001_U300009 [Pseudomonas sp. OF001]|nr:hypothetical protein OF001_U300009 [Pseudomonas sp. OF001]